MYQKIMIPLDGSELAECVLPCVENFMKDGVVKKVVFIMVVEPQPITPYDAPVTFGTVKHTATPHKDLFPTNLEYWEKKSSGEMYLGQIARRFNRYRVETECEVLEGRVAETLAGYAEDTNIDLILIDCHA
jgi:nucleotide-binding universal stress UspA family protein